MIDKQHNNPPSFTSTMALTDPQKERYDAQVERMVALLERRHKDASYQNEYKKFVYWAEENNHGVGGKYIYRESVDEYFRIAVVDRTCAKASISRIIQALQWMYNNLEVPAGDFVVRSPVVAAAVDQQQENRRNSPSCKLGTDPHKGLKDVLAESDKKKIASYMHRHRPDWGSLSTSFSWGNNAGVRGASTRKFGYAEMYTSKGFGPAKEGPRAQTMLLVLRAGDPHKDKFTTDRMVGCWRHRIPVLCATGNLSLHVINDLRQDQDIEFLHADKTVRASWWDKPLIDYDTLDDETGPMKEVYAATGVSGCKLTHNRTYAVQQAGSEGLAPFQINSFTKHMLEKMHKSYQAEVDKEACKVMAGFSKDEGYFVEREHLELPFAIAALIDFLLPSYREWVTEHQSENGDKSSCCRNFLFDTIPYMVRVVVQDGIYLVRDFPEHQMSNYLKVRKCLVCFFDQSCN